MRDFNAREIYRFADISIEKAENYRIAIYRFIDLIGRSLLERLERFMRKIEVTITHSWIRPNVIFKKMFVLSQKYSIDKNSFSGRSFLNEVYY